MGEESDESSAIDSGPIADGDEPEYFISDETALQQDVQYGETEHQIREVGLSDEYEEEQVEIGTEYRRGYNTPQYGNGCPNMQQQYEKGEQPFLARLSSLLPLLACGPWMATTSEDDDGYSTSAMQQCATSTTLL